MSVFCSSDNKLLGGLTCWLLPECHLCQLQHLVSRNTPGSQGEQLRRREVAGMMRQLPMASSDGAGTGTRLGTAPLALTLALFQPWHPIPKPGAESQRKAQQSAVVTAVGCGAGGVGWGYRGKRVSWRNLLSPLRYSPSHKLVWTFALCWKTTKGKSWHIFHLQETPGWPWNTTACVSTPGVGMTLDLM